MKLSKATYTNFKGLKQFTFEPSGNNASVLGDNGTGKTTLLDGILWLLFGKDSQNKKDFDIKTLTPDGQPIHNLNHEVEAVFELNGKQLILKKSFAEKWTRKRGSATSEFTGHTTDHFIDDVPVSAGEYANKIASICDEETFKLLTSPTYFNTQLHWQKRREVLLQVCGDVSDSDVIASDKTLKELPGILGDRSIDDHRKVIAASRKKINDELQKIPVRIDEAERGLPDVAGLDMAALAIERGQLVKLLEAKQVEISRIKNGGEVAEKTKRLRELESELLDIKNKYRAKADEQVQGKRQELDLLKSHDGDLRRSISNEKSNIACNEDHIVSLEKTAEKLRQSWYTESSREFTFEQEDACPACSQPLPEEKLTEAREKALAVFNQSKSQGLENISVDGKHIKAEITRLKTENEESAKELTYYEEQLKLSEAKISTLQEQIETITASATDPSESPDYKQALAAKQKLERKISDLQTSTRELLTAAQEEEHSIKSQIQSVDDDLQKIRMREQGETRIKELSAEEKKLAAAFEKTEMELYLTEQFIKAKVSLLEGKINSKFKHARFKLFSTNINGGIEPCCETLYNGVPYSSGLNRGHQGIVGLDIIATLCEHYDFYPPIVFDNAESTTRLPDMKNQMICLYVSERDKKLRVEVEGAENTLFGEAV